MKPQDYTERYYFNIIFGYGTAPTPHNREQTFLKAIADTTPCGLDPWTRTEHFLAYLSGDAEDYPTGIHNRKELFLKAVCDADGSTLPAPQTREELLLSIWAKYGTGIDVTTTGTDAITLSESNPIPLKVAKFYGNTVKVFEPTINQWDENWEEGAYDIFTGDKLNTSTQIRSKNKIKVLPDTDYYAKVPGNTMWVLFFDDNEDLITGYSTGIVTSGNASGVNNSVFTTPPNGRYVVFYMVSSYGTTYNNNLSINYPATDTEYHPANYVIKNINQGYWELRSNPSERIYMYGLQLNGIGTAKDVYDAVDGSIERKIGVVDLSTFTYTYEESTNRFLTYLSGIKQLSTRLLQVVSPIYECLYNGEQFDVNWINKIYTINTAIYIHTTGPDDPPKGLLYYPLATSTTEAAPIQNIELSIIDDDTIANHGDLEQDAEVTYNSYGV